MFMKILSWNINGVRAVLKKDFLGFLIKENPDVICLQEVKIDQSKIEKENFDFPFYEVFWNSAKRAGYSGTATLVRKDLVVEKVINGFGVEKFDNEGRCQIIEFDDFYLVNNYFPNANSELSRLDYKLEYNEILFDYLKNLTKKKNILVCGDFNVAHQEIDLARPKENIGSPGFTYEERKSMNKFLNNGFVDTFRKLNPLKVQYSWWSYRAGARQRNVGWRIDYFCTNDIFLKNIKKAFIMDEIKGSDHCPVGVILNLE